MAFCAKVTTALTAVGARLLKERPWTCLCRWIVYSRVTTSWSAERVLPPVYSTDVGKDGDDYILFLIVNMHLLLGLALSVGQSDGFSSRIIMSTHGNHVLRMSSATAANFW